MVAYPQTPEERTRAERIRTIAERIERNEKRAQAVGKWIAYFLIGAILVFAAIGIWVVIDALC